MVDSIDVLNGLKIVYTLYVLLAVSVMIWFAYKITKTGSTEVVKPGVFYTYIGILVVLGVSLHIATYNTVPWVPVDLNRNEIKADKTFDITIKKHKFYLPQDKLMIDCDDFVLFNLTTEDVTYGFGIFRQDGTMVTQMQVVPGSRNDLLWRFHKNGIYTIRSTEYSGPAGYNMVLKDVIEVSGCEVSEK